MMKLNMRKTVAVLAAVATLGVAGPVAVTAAQAADNAPAATSGVVTLITVKFHKADGGIAGTLQNISGTTFGAFVDQLAKQNLTPTKDGATPIAWSTKADGTGFVFNVTEDRDVQIELNFDLYPVFEQAPAAEQVTVTFEDGRGNQIGVPVSKDKGTKFSEFAKGVNAPASEGNKFAGWTEDGINVIADDYPVAGNITVVPFYVQDTTTPAPVQVTVTFHGRDGQPGWPVVKTLDKGTLFSEFLKALDGYTLPSMPGYTLTGWNTKADGTGLTVTGDVQIDNGFDAYPVFAKNPVEQVTVTFHGRDGQPGWPVKVTLDKNAAFSEFVKGLDGYTLPSMDGYTLKGWSYKADGPVFDGDVTIGDSFDAYPVFEKDAEPAPAKVSVAFEDEDGNVVANIPGQAGDLFGSFAKQVTAPAVAGKTFVGWALEGGAAAEEGYAVNTDLTVKAVYKANPKPQPQFPWWGSWWNAFQQWWGSWTQWGHGWWW